MPSPVVNSSNFVAPVRQSQGPAPAEAPRNEMMLDELDLKISDEDKETISNVETKVTYWTFAAEALRQVSLFPAFLTRHANGALRLLETNGWAKLATYFEMAERGSKWLYLDPAHLKALGQAASRLTRFESACLGVARGVGKVLPWAAPAFASWDVCRAIWEHDPKRRDAAFGNAILSVFAALTSFAFPGFSMLLVGVQMLDAMKGQPLARVIGRVFRRDWAETRARQVGA